MKKIVFICFSWVFIITNSVAQVVINEVHYNPANDISGDANGDGVRSASHDEFIELVNYGDIAVDLSGWTLSDADGVFFTFPTKTFLNGIQALVVFGGGDPKGLFGEALLFKSSLGLNNADNVVVLKNTNHETVDSMFYKASSAIGNSLTRHPDITGDFVPSTNIGLALYSPGFTSDLKSFSTITFLNQPEKLSVIEVYPNPVSGNTLFLMGFDQISTVELMNLFGESHLLTFENGILSIPSTCKNGIWILKVESKTGVFQQKVEILR